MKNQLKLKNLVFLGLLLLGLGLLLVGILRRQKEYPAPPTVIYKNEEKIRIYGTENAYLTSHGARIVPGADYYEFSGDVDFYPDREEKAVIVHFTVSNEGQEAEAIEFNRFPVSYLASKNGAQPMNMYKKLEYNQDEQEWEVERIDSLEVEAGGESEVYMVVTFLEGNDPPQVWENFEKNDIYLTVSYYPIHQKIRLN